MTSTPTHPAASVAPLLAPTAGSRRAEIAEVAAEEFTRRGYHSTKVEHIAERLSVTPGALYRHVPGKYEMFRDAVAVLATDVITAALATPPDDLDGLTAALTSTTLSHRTRTSLHRWQDRYLTHADHALVAHAMEQTRNLMVEAVLAHREATALRPADVHGADPARGQDTGRRQEGGRVHGVGTAAEAILSVIASLGDHRLDLAPDVVIEWTTATARTLALAETSGEPVLSAPPTPPTGPAPRGGAATREAAITAAISRFHKQGYDDVTMEAIGSDVGVAASALYRHFSGKSALLASAVDRTAALIETTLDQHAALRGPDDDPVGLLTDLLDAYVTIAFSHGPDLLLYYSELGTLAKEDRDRLRTAQRAQLARWTGLVCMAAPETSADAARLRVQAALSLVLDGGKNAGFHPAAAGRLRDLARTTLLDVPRAAR